MTKEIEEFIKELREYGHKSVNTQMSYQRDLIKLQNYLNMRKVDHVADVTLEILQDYLKELASNGTAVASISRCTASIHRFFEYLMETGQINENPAVRLKAPHVETKCPEILTEAEIKNLMATPQGNTPKIIRDRAILNLLYATGLRVSELISLKMDNLYLKKGYVISNLGKERIIPIDKHTVKILDEYLKVARVVFEKNKGAKEIFLNFSGNKLSRQGLWKLLKTYGEKAGLKKELTPHVLRHSFAVHVLNSGTDIEVLSKMLGHSDLSTTKVYQNLAGK